MLENEDKGAMQDRMSKIRILIVDDSREFLEVEKNFLSMEPHIEVVGEAVSGQEAIDLTGLLKPDLVLMDIAMPDISGIEAAKRIKEKAGAPYVVILTLYDNPEYKSLSEAAGADGFVTKSEFAVTLIPLINKLFSEKPQLSRKEHKKMSNILVVDDSLTMRRMIMASLRGIKGARFIEATNGLEAIEQIALERIDLMTLDLNMPDMHGIEVLNFIRQHRAYKDIPIIVLTTKADDKSRDEALNAGASVYLTKPFKPEELFNCAARLIGGLRG
ncbi:MAG TPA: response regulator [Syntrophorhabdaceae bacterium]|nr:response regulator [Syntrophorhabdaceae bacterium]HOL05489.1 response regulator [Syntrophorhabdaceae bacterium]HON85470.1 response regulator [Syntrophorhabdaceae bacterium]HPC66902.1 response regulator [Syntrophorhabdaceae bacterium]HPP42099.1 response regulator [Syntrophorhabdaceae bacterium]